ncbi:MAG: hypothetical protein K1W25_17360 [Lachnospiraceae bacterium]
MNDWKTGEKEFLQALHKRTGSPGLDWRDDCMIKAITPELSLVYSLDSLNRSPSNNRANDSNSFGKWSASVIANDVIACGVAPEGLALDIGLSAFRDEEDLYRFIDGVLDVCTCYHMNYEGGNLNKGSFIGGVCWGLSKPDAIIKREGAQNDSILLATARIGLGWAIELLQRFKGSDQHTQDAKFTGEITRFKTDPVINLPVFQEIWRLGVIDCGMDLTDGIVEFGYEIFDRTGLGVVFSPENPHKLVSYVSSLLQVEPDDIMFEPGYDTPYAHGWCIQKSNVKLVCSTLSRYGIPYTILGEVTKDVFGVYRKKKNTLKPLPRYWDDKIKKESDYELWRKNIIDFA